MSGGDTRRPVVLVVEDNPTTRKMLRVALVAAGYAVVEAADGREALERFAAQRPGLVLQDLLLPDVDGLELVRRLRALPGGAEVPMVACSGMLPKLEEARLLAVGFDDFLLKPVELDRLVQAVQARLPLARPPPPQARRGQRALVADDDPVRRRLVELQLELAGFDVEAAIDGQRALEQARRSRPDVIVADLMMPNLDGFGLCLAARLDRELARVPLVLYTSSYQEDSDRELASRVGANALVGLAGDINPLVGAVVQSLSEGAPLPPVQYVELAQQERLHRVLRHLERQVALSAGLTQRCAVLSAQLSILAGITQSLAAATEVDGALGDVLTRCLEAGEVSVGALYREAAGGLGLASRAGAPDLADSELEAWLGGDGLLARVHARGETQILPSAEAPGSAEVLARAGLRSVLLVPVVSGGVGLGVLVLGSSVRALSEPESLDFARTVAAQIGQALVLARQVQVVEAEMHGREQFLVFVSHELRAPLSVLERKLQQAVRVAKRALAGSELARVAGDLEAAGLQVRRLSRLVGGTLDVAGVSGGPLELRLEEVDLAQVVREVAELHAEELDRGGCALRLRLERPVVGRWDRARLEQLAGSLLSNALEHGAGKPIEIEVATDGAGARLAVTDHGLGMSEDDLERLFARLERAATSRDYRGLGLGLWLVRQIVEALDGRIRVTSAPGAGATFTIELPRGGPAGAPPGPEPAAAGPSSGPGGS